MTASKLFEGWDIDLASKIKESLSAKVFIWVSASLILCSVLIYGIIIIALPHSYQVVINDRVQQDVASLASELSQMSLDQGKQHINDFCLQNNVSAVLFVDNTSFFFNTNSKTQNEKRTITVASAVNFTDKTASSYLTVTMKVSHKSEITDSFLKLLPFILLLTVIISSASALLCNRVLVKPIVEISNISKRMSELDMTWRCKVTRSDEVGVLARSLNGMAERLSEAMKSLEVANRNLREDIAVIQRMEKQRRDFFAAVSHELKTPITILKGQLESMLMGIGDYRNIDKYLPQSLAAVEDMEYLVKEILAVSKMEAMGFDGGMVRTSIVSILNQVIQDLSPLANEKQITIEVQVMEDVIATVHPQMFEKALSNILSNAVRHSPEKANVVASLSHGILSVENSGVVISKEDLPYMFTPFYRIDKSRSKATGGSGLGLYIVKTILDLHKFTYSINSLENSVLFIINLNQN